MSARGADLGGLLRELRSSQFRPARDLSVGADGLLCPCSDGKKKLSGLCHKAGTASRREGMSMLERISIDPTIRYGKPCIQGTRLTVGELLLDFPQLFHDDVLACFAFAAERERRLMVAVNTD